MIQVLIHAAAQNYTGTYIIMDCLQALVNNLLAWQSSYKSKLRPLNSKCISPAAKLVIGASIGVWHVN